MTPETMTIAEWTCKPCLLVHSPGYTSGMGRSSQRTRTMDSSASLSPWPYPWLSSLRKLAQAWRMQDMSDEVVCATLCPVSREMCEVRLMVPPETWRFFHSTPQRHRRLVLTETAFAQIRGLDLPDKTPDQSKFWWHIPCWEAFLNPQAARPDRPR